MSLTPQDIYNKKFKSSFRGFDKAEVNSFLDQIIIDYDNLHRLNEQLVEKNNAATAHLSKYKEIEEILNKTLIVAQETAESVKANSKKEAQHIIDEANKNADRIVSEAISKATKVSLEVEELRNEAKLYRAKMKMLIDQQLIILSDEGWENNIPQKVAETYGQDTKVPILSGHGSKVETPFGRDMKVSEPFSHGMKAKVPYVNGPKLEEPYGHDKKKDRHRNRHKKPVSID